MSLAIGGMLLVRRSVTLSTLENHNQVAGYIYGVVGVVYAVLLAFIVIVVWQQHTQVQIHVEREANQLGDLYRNTRVFPEEIRTRLQNQIRAYSRIVVEKEWPAMTKDETSPDAWVAINQLWRAYQQVEARNDHERLWYAKSIDQLERLGDYRRLRLLSNRAAVPVLSAGGVGSPPGPSRLASVFSSTPKQPCPSAHDCSAVGDDWIRPVLDLGFKSSFCRFGSR